MSELIAKPIINEKLIKHKEMVKHLQNLLEKCSQTKHDSSQMIQFWLEYSSHFGQDQLYNDCTGATAYSEFEPYVYQQSITDLFNQKMIYLENQFRDFESSQETKTKKFDKTVLIRGRMFHLFS